MSPNRRASIDEALDNDIILKAVRYRATQLFWPEPRRLGVLGAARYVVGDRIKRSDLAMTTKTIDDELTLFLARAEVLEPSDDEITRAAELELLLAKVIDRKGVSRPEDVDSRWDRVPTDAVTRAPRTSTAGCRRRRSRFRWPPPGWR